MATLLREKAPPAWKMGAGLFSVGGGHAAKGDGEACITGPETSPTGSLEFIVRKDMKLKFRRAETPSHHIVMGWDKDLTETAKLATREAIDFLSTQKGLRREDCLHRHPSEREGSTHR